MLRGIYSAAAAMAAQEGRVEVAANNLANVDTTGFKRELALLGAGASLSVGRMEKRASPLDPGARAFQPLGMIALGSGVWNVARDIGQGVLKETGSKLDLAISGRGFFSVLTEKGRLFTRAGAFLVNEAGFLSTPEGGLLLDESGVPIHVGDGAFVVREDGTLYDGDGRYLGRLMLVDFPFPGYLSKVGSNYFETSPISGEPFPAVNPRVLQGYLEGSNLRAVEEMVRMISALRSYERSQKVIQSYDETLGRAVNDVGKI